MIRNALAALAIVAAAPALAAPAHSSVETANIAAVTAFYDAALNEKDADKARQYLGATYKQHNPVAKDGVEGLVGFVQFLKAKFPANHGEIKAAFADGDTVILHVLSRRTPADRGNAVVDIFRLEKGKIVEHWDVMQPIPEQSANTNTMF